MKFIVFHWQTLQYPQPCLKCFLSLVLNEGSYLKMLLPLKWHKTLAHMIVVGIRLAPHCHFQMSPSQFSFKYSNSIEAQAIFQPLDVCHPLTAHHCFQSLKVPCWFTIFSLFSHYHYRWLQHPYELHFLLPFL